MSEDDQIALVDRYFSAVDREELDILLSTLSDDCTFRVETHGVLLRGHHAITGMFRRLWANHAAVRHHDFVYTAAPAANRIVAQFKVENTEHDGAITRKSNANFFVTRNGVFSQVSVYMTGRNTLEAAR